MNYLSPNLSFDIVEKYIDKPWNLSVLSHNPNITSDIVEKHINKPWDWQMLSNNPNITSDIVEEHNDKPWNWYDLSRHPNITFHIIEKHIDKHWDWCVLSLNPNITFDFIKKYKHKFIHNIAFVFGMNKFTAEKNRFLESLRKERIQKRTLEYKEELIANVFHPKRIKKMLLTDIEYLDMI